MTDDFIGEAEKELEKLGIKITKNTYKDSFRENLKANMGSVVVNPAVNKIVSKIETLGFADSTVPTLRKFISRSNAAINFVTSNISVVKEFVGMTNVRESFLADGKAYLENVLGMQADCQISLKYEKELSNIVTSDLDILSDEIVSNSNLSKPIREKIKAYSEQAKDYIFATAALIEKQKFEDFDEMMESIKAREGEK